MRFSRQQRNFAKTSSRYQVADWLRSPITFDLHFCFPGCQDEHRVSRRSLRNYFFALPEANPFGPQSEVLQLSLFERGEERLTGQQLQINFLGSREPRRSADEFNLLGGNGQPYPAAIE